jgi:hypothetical protein
LLRIFLFFICFIRSNIANNTNWLFVIQALTDGYIVSLVFRQDGANRADECGFVAGREATVAEFAAARVDYQVTVNAATVYRKNIFMINIPTGTDTQLAQYAAVKINDGVRM